MALASSSANAQNLLTNGNLDVTQSVEIVPGFFLPKPADWINEGSRAISGPYEDEMSSEPWAGPAPTPVTTDGSGNPVPDGCGGTDCAVFFKAFSGNVADGAATGHLYQDNPATPGLTYTLTGWAGAEANFLGEAQLALEFLDAGGIEVPASGSELDLLAAGLLVDNGEAFDYKQFTVMATAPAGAAWVRARASMINGLSNPAGGGQAYVVDDFELTAVPEPSTMGLGLVGVFTILTVHCRRRSIA
jgi:hypothetical protein